MRHSSSFGLPKPATMAFAQLSLARAVESKKKLLLPFDLELTVTIRSGHTPLPD
jgi:hypothetical protein